MAHAAEIAVTNSRSVLTITPQQRDSGVFALWAIVTFVQFRYDELLLYPLALYYAYAIWRDQTRILPMLGRAWVLMLYPAWCLLSSLWAVDPASALKHGLYVTLTMLICFNVAMSMTQRQVLHALLLATGTIGVVNLLVAVGTGDMRTGIFPQKNAMGKNMVVLWIVGAAVMLDQDSPRLLRLAGGGLAAIAFTMAIQSESATAVLLCLGSGLVLTFGALFLVGDILRLQRLAILCFGLGIAAAAAAVIVPTLQASPVDAVLDYFGKDRTLTGRTVLWDYAEDQIRERPLLGVGADGFWRYHESPLIQKIYEQFHKGPRDHFNFHNSYYEIAVHQGLIGLGIATVAMAWGVVQIVRGTFRIATVPVIYFFAQMLTVLTRTTTEADFLRPFVLFHMTFWIGALSATRLMMAGSGALQARPGGHEPPRFGSIWRAAPNR